LRVKPIDITRSDWPCILEKISSEADEFCLRLGLRYVKELREGIGKQIVEQRNICPFDSVEDLKQRIPDIQKAEMKALAAIGALNFIEPQHAMHRRDALWQIERAARYPGALFEPSKPLSENGLYAAEANESPLSMMSTEERLIADYHSTGLTIGPHPLAYHRNAMKKRGLRTAIELQTLRDGALVRIAGSVVVRQRPGTAKGFVFLSMEDETGIANVIITPQIFQANRAVIVHQQFLLIEGILQNQDGVVSVKAGRIRPLEVTRAETTSHDFH
ncbi:MAG TPA: OB-fold nucleic acid binding domain-containing protein, partial [Candidatus Acidoferrales bacterium]